MASQAAAVDAATADESAGISRREFLYYVWGASIALLALQGAGLLVWFLIPRFREGEFGGTFRVPIDDLPPTNAEPNNFADGRFWLVNLDSTQPNEMMYSAPDEPAPIQGVAAIYKVCTHLGCIYSWTPTNARFECPCHGSKYRLDGRRIEVARAAHAGSLSPSRLLPMTKRRCWLNQSSTRMTSGNPWSCRAGTAFIRVDTGARKQGPSRELLCNFTGSCP